MFLRFFVFTALFCVLSFAQGEVSPALPSNPAAAPSNAAAVHHDSAAAPQPAAAAAPEASAFGTLSVQSSVPAGVWVSDEAIGNTPILMGISAGWQIYIVRAENHWPEVFLVNVKAGEQSSQEVSLKKFDLPSLEMRDISNEKDVKVLEKLYDSLTAAKAKVVPDSVCIAEFARSYPLPSLAPEGLTEKSVEYRNYYAIYDREKKQSFKEWHAGCAAPVKQNLRMVQWRINKLGAEQINGYVPVAGAKFEPLSPDGLRGNLLLVLRSKDGRADVAWRGIWQNEFLPGDDLVRALAESEPVALSFVTVQNQTVWIPTEGGYSRHFYKYRELNISWNGLLIPMKGEFVLPDYLIEQPEVAAWLGISPEKAPPEAVVEDTVPAAAETQVAVARPGIARIPGGTLVQNKDAEKKVTEIRPFSINTSQISQKEYGATCGEKKFEKYKGDSIPAHSVTWFEANDCCKALGGDLPTEAEWEYAARAGIPNEYAWSGDAADYAVFGEKNLSKIASKKPNGWGLYDMFGNVSEWVKDEGFWYGKYRYLKGGSYKSKEKGLKVETSEEEDMRYWGTHVGFRCVYRD